MKFGIHVRRVPRAASFGVAIEWDWTWPREAGLAIGFWRWVILIGAADPDWSK